MRESGTLSFVRRVVLCVVGVAVLVGCSEAKPRKAGRNLLAKVKVAQRRYNKALSLLEAPVFEHVPTGKVSPLEGAPKLTKADLEDPKSPKIRVFPLSAVNPKVFVVLKEAKDELSKALAADKQADASMKALAEAMLGRIESLRGRCHVRVAEAGRMSAHNGLDELERMHSLLREQVFLAGQYKDMLASGKVSNEDLARMVREAERHIATYTASRDDYDGKIKALQKRRDLLVLANNVLAREIRDIRGKAVDPLVSTKKAREYLEAALAKVAVSDGNAARKATIENTIDSLSRERGDVLLLLTAALGRHKAATGALEDSRKILEGDDDAGKERKVPSADEEKVPSVAEELKKMESARGATQGRIATLAAAVVKAVADARTADELAKDALDRSAGALKNAARLERPRRPETLSAQGDQCMALAEMVARRLRLHSRASLLAGSIEEVWKQTPTPLPPVLKEFGQFVSEPDESRKEALEMYNQAAGHYKDAVSAARRNLKWAYWFKKADAHIGAYQLSADDQARDDAVAAIEEAVKGKESSPYIKTNAAERLERLGL